MPCPACGRPGDDGVCSGCGPREHFVGRERELRIALDEQGARPLRSIVDFNEAANGLAPR
jgi:hypothetical protein